jgi:hypothetical protein
MLAGVLLDCLNMVCPDSTGGVCDPNAMMPAQCMACYANAQRPGAACYNAAVACNQDTP